MKYIDLTQTFKQTMPVYPGDSSPELKQVCFINKDGCNTFAIRTGMHVGTHMDGPLHMLKNGRKLSTFPVQYFFGRGHLIDARKKQINKNLLKNHKIKKGDIVIIMTGFYKKFNKLQYYKNYPAILEDFAHELVRLGVKIVGMDTPSPDYPPFIIHKILLSKNILIIENLTNLEALLNYKKFNIIALPAKFEADSAPVRVIAETR